MTPSQKVFVSERLGLRGSTAHLVPGKKENQKLEGLGRASPTDIVVGGRENHLQDRDMSVGALQAQTILAKDNLWSHLTSVR